MSVILIGYRGSGKTSVGRVLASKLGWPFVDADERIVERAGMPIREIFDRHGEPHFRDLESQILRELCDKTNQVLALGGGAVIREENRDTLRRSGHVVVYLHSDPETLAGRIRSDPQSELTRPSLTRLGGGEDEIRLLLIKRLPLYREVKTHEIHVTHLSPDQVAERIVSMVRPASG